MPCKNPIYVFDLFDKIVYYIYRGKEMVKRRLLVSLFVILTVSAVATVFFGCAQGKHFVTLYDGDEVLTTVLSDADGKVVLPTPEKTGYVFDGWYVDDVLSRRFESDIRIGSDTKLYCGWIGHKYTVTLDVAGGDKLNRTEYECGSGIALSFLPEPTREHYTFLGWVCDGEPVDIVSSFEYATDVTFTARWKPDTFVVTYYGNGGVLTDEEGRSLVGNYAVQTVEYDAPFTPYSAKKDGSTFMGWQTSDGSLFAAPSVWRLGDDVELTAIYG